MPPSARSGRTAPTAARTWHFVGRFLPPPAIAGFGLYLDDPSGLAGAPPTRLLGQLFGLREHRGAHLDLVDVLAQDGQVALGPRQRLACHPPATTCRGQARLR